MTSASLPGVVWEASRLHIPECLYASETDHVRDAVDRRTRQFATVRGCARRALRRLGQDRPPMVPGRSGEPQWPEGVVGSMTHTDGYCAVAVAERSLVLSIGIDAEPNEPLSAGVAGLISADRERVRERLLSSTGSQVAWGRLLFSAKESVYKAWFPVIGTWLGFKDVEISLDPDGGFRAILINAERGARGAELVASLVGRWWIEYDHIITGALITA